MKWFVEVDSLSRIKHNSSVAGEVVVTRRQGDRVMMVLAQGGQTGIRANVVASTIASMAIGYTLNNELMVNAARSILDTFGGGVAAFTIVDIQPEGAVRVIEYQMPQFVLLRGAAVERPACRMLDFMGENGVEHTVRLTEFEARFQDRLVLVSSGVVHSGVGTSRFSDRGWTIGGLVEMLESSVRGDGDLSAHQIALLVVSRSMMNDLFVAKNDMSCGTIYFRAPRRMLLCTGPPFNENNDARLSEIVGTFDGTKVVSGGTTARILAREMGREIHVKLQRDVSGLPPTSLMQGVDLITEGVLTLARVKSILEQTPTAELQGRGIDYNLSRMLLSHDVIYFVVGTRVNAQHQDPNLPVELELRRNVIKDIARLLRDKFFKEVRIEHL